MEKKEITRIVKMVFAEEHVSEFLNLFAENRERIGSFPGCYGVNLARDKNEPNIFFTISRWRSEDDLEEYRRSDLFQSVWSRTKILFAGKPEAWTLVIS